MYLILTDGGHRQLGNLSDALTYLQSLGARGVGATLMTTKWDRYHLAGGVIAQTLAERKLYRE